MTGFGPGTDVCTDTYRIRYMSKNDIDLLGSAVDQKEMYVNKADMSSWVAIWAGKYACKVVSTLQYAVMHHWQCFMTRLSY